MGTIRLTMAQALVRYLSAQQIDLDGKRVTLFAGVWAIFGHGNVAGIGEALQAHRDVLPTYRAHNEQAMALAAIGLCQGDAPAPDHGLHDIDRPGGDEHGDGGGGGDVDRLPVLLFPAMCSRRAGLTRCCSRSRASAMARYRRTTVSARCRATSIGSRDPNRSLPHCRAPFRC